VSIDFYRQLRDFLSHDECVAIATVTQVNGSVPREVSAKMLIRQNGDILGTIGGGAGEAKVIQYAQTLLNSAASLNDGDSIEGSHSEEERKDEDRHEPLVAHGTVGSSKGWVTIDLTGARQRATEGVCGGVMTVWVERWQPDWGCDLCDCILQAWQDHQTPVLITPLDAMRHPYLDTSSQLLARPEASPRQFVEQLRPPPLVLIIGAGHVGVALAKVAAIAGFSVAVYDDRPDMLQAHRFPSGVMLKAGAIAPALTPTDGPPASYIALVTRGVMHDLNALKALGTILPNPAIRYIGMIGSLKRVKHVFKLAEEKGIDPQYLQHIHAPIGLEIGALTPEEIAISICAEMIQTRRTST
jgi:xanthine dehydrogenase accessory factor